MFLGPTNKKATLFLWVALHLLRPTLRYRGVVYQNLTQRLQPVAERRLRAAYEPLQLRDEPIDLFLCVVRGEAGANEPAAVFDT